jgi:hypothetical protein
VTAPTIPRTWWILLVCVYSVVLEGTAHVRQARVQPLFDLSTPDGGPFPSDRFTVADPDQLTGRRVNLPRPPDCAATPSDCEDIAVLNQLDGFNMLPRVSIPFSGDIDPASVTGNVFFLKLNGGPTPRISLNYVVWDPATHELSGRPDVPFEQHTTYVLVITMSS